MKLGDTVRVTNENSEYYNTYGTYLGDDRAHKYPDTPHVIRLHGENICLGSGDVEIIEGAFRVFLYNNREFFDDNETTVVVAKSMDDAIQMLQGNGKKIDGEHVSIIEIDTSCSGLW